MARKSRREYLTPELTPLIDVVFLLLIFFMVSSVFKKEELALLLNLPKAEQGKQETQAKAVITIELSENDVAYDGEKLDMENLEAKVKTLKKE